MTKMYQVDLEGVIFDGVHARPQMTTWVPLDERLKVGKNIKLKGDTTVWRVKKIYDSNVQELSEVVSNRGFDNNNYDHHKGLGIH